jgi:hypothetical protein
MYSLCQFFFNCFAEWQYIVTFAKVLTIYQIYHTCIHPFYHSLFPLILPFPIPGIVSTGINFPFTYICTQFLHHSHTEGVKLLFKLRGLIFKKRLFLMQKTSMEMPLWGRASILQRQKWILGFLASSKESQVILNHGKTTPTRSLKLILGILPK